MIFHSDPAKAAGMDTAVESWQSPALGLAVDWEECPKGLVLLENHFTQGGLNFRGHGMWKVLSQRLPRLWQGVPAVEVQLPSFWGQLLLGVSSGKKEQLLLSKATKKPPEAAGCLAE